MEYTLSDIKHIRKQLGLTQSGLAQKADVSQSLIAKIESGLIDPSYSNTKRIFDTLDLLKSKKEKTAKDLMQKHIITLASNTPIRIAVDRMHKNSISQIPVIDNERVVGLITESDLLRVIADRKSVNSISDIMEDAPPTVSISTGAKVILNLLKFYDLVLVVDKGKVSGLITKADILSKMY